MQISRDIFLVRVTKVSKSNISFTKSERSGIFDMIDDLLEQEELVRNE